MQGATIGHAALESFNHLISEFLHGIVYACRGSCTATFDSQKGLGHGNSNLVDIKMGDLAITADYLESE